MSAPNFELVTELQVTIRRDFPLVAAQAGVLNPLNAVPLVEGEWLEMGAGYMLQRGTGAQTNLAVFPVHTERGRYDTQAVGKVNVIYLGQYEAESAICAQNFAGAVGSELTIDTVADASGVNRRGLRAAANGEVVVGIVTKVTTGAVLKVRFLHMANYLKTA